MSALLLLIVAPSWTVAADEVKPATGSVSAERIDQLINRLGNDDYFVRQQAQEELARLGLEAFDALSRAESNSDIEIAERARYLIRLLQFDLVQEDDPPDVKKLLQSYKQADDDQRLQAIIELASLPDDRGLTAVCRLVRYERSQLISKRAALVVVEQKNISDERWSRRTPILLSSLGNSPRTAAAWLRNYARQGREPKEAAAGWTQLAAAEIEMLQARPQMTRPELVLGLLKQAVIAHRKLGEDEAADKALRLMTSVEPGQNETLVDLLQWLIEQKAWPIVDETSRRYAERFETDPMLLYALAEACLAQGNTDLADKNAARALEFNADNQEQHWMVASQLNRRGLRRWAEAEYRKVISSGPPGTTLVLAAQAVLSEMLHDDGQDGKAAKVLEESVAVMEQKTNAGQALQFMRDLKTSRGQMHYFFACDADQRGDAKEHKRRLLLAKEDDPTNADVLIGLYRLPNPEPALRDETKRLIREAAELFRRRIREEPEQAINYNQIAWLIGNTEGDYQEAIRSSHKSLELQPNTAGYLDTLGRCYYAIKDYDNAIKYQSQAVELDPHSGLMRKQLALFERARAAAKGEPKKPENKQ